MCCCSNSRAMRSLDAFATMTFTVLAVTAERSYYSITKVRGRNLVRGKLCFRYQGQYSSWQKQPRGSPSTVLAPIGSSLFLWNRDQFAN